MSDERPIVNVQTSATQIALEAGGHTEVTTLTADGQVTLQAVSQEVAVPLTAERAADVALHHPADRVALEMAQGARVEVELQMSGGYSTPPDATEWGHIEGTLADQEDLHAALEAKASVAALSAHVSNTMNPHSVTKNQIGLWHVDNTSDVDKPISSATQTALDG